MSDKADSLNRLLRVKLPEHLSQCERPQQLWQQCLAIQDDPRLQNDPRHEKLDCMAFEHAAKSCVKQLQYSHDQTQTETQSTQNN
ncbi:MAG: hypothetical protein MHM6MM_003128 [Cercozoa sp. M6MM]